MKKDLFDDNQKEWNLINANALTTFFQRNTKLLRTVMDGARLQHARPTQSGIELWPANWRCLSIGDVHDWFVKLVDDDEW